MVESLIVESEPFVPAEMTSDTTPYFVEITKDALGRTVSTGECGDPDETLHVDGGGGSIAFTPGDSSPALWVGGVALLALFGAAGAYMIRRRQIA